MPPHEWYARMLWHAVWVGDEAGSLTQELAPVLGFENDAEGLVRNTWFAMVKISLVDAAPLAAALAANDVPAYFKQQVALGAAGRQPVVGPVADCKALNAQPERIDAMACRDVRDEAPRPLSTFAKAGDAQPETHACTVADEIHGRKLCGNTLFKNGNFEGAIARYAEALERAGTGSWRFLATQSILYSNTAQCYLNLERWNEARRAATTAHKLDPSNEKAQARKEKAEEALMGKLKGIDRDARQRELKETCSQQ